MSEATALSSGYVAWRQGPILVTSLGDEVVLPTLQAWLVAIVYSVSPTGIDTSTIVRLLWGKAKTERMAGNLSQLIYKTNRSFPDGIVLERRGEEVFGLLPERGKLLRVPVGAPSAEAEFFLEQRIRSIRSDHLRSLWREYETELHSGNYTKCIELLETVLTVDIDRVAALLDLAWIESRSGRIRSAEERLVSYSRSDAAPESKLQARTALDLLRKGLPLNPSSKVPPGGPTIPMIGRDAVLSEIRSLLAQAEVSHVILRGDAGVGKSRVLAEALQELVRRRPELHVARVCVERLNRDRAFALIDKILIELGVEELPQAYEPAEESLTSFCERVQRAVQSKLKGRRVIIGIDDLHFADPSSVMVLEVLNRSSVRGPWLFISTVGPHTEPDYASLGEYFSGAADGIRIIELDELKVEVSDLILSKARPSMSPIHRDLVIRQLGGVPALLLDEDLVDELVATEAVSLKPSFSTLIEAKISRLDPDSIFVARTVSAIRDPVSAEALRRLCDVAPLEILRVVERLVKENILIRRAGLLSLKSRILRTVLYRGMLPGERRLMHKGIAEAAGRKLDISVLEQAHHTALAGLPTAQVYGALREAAERLEKQGAIPEALQHLMSASELPEADRDAYLFQQLSRLATLVRRHDVASRALERLRCVAIESKEIELALRSEVDLVMSQARLDPSSVPTSQVRDLVERCISAEAWDTAARAVEFGLMLMDYFGDGPTMRRLLIDADKIHARANTSVAGAWVCLARSRYVYLGEVALGLPAAHRAVELAEEVGDEWLLGRALNRLVVCLYFNGRLHLAVGQEATRRCTKHVEATHDELLQQDLWYNLSNWLLDVGEVQAAQDRIQILKDRLPQRKSPLEEARICVLQGEILLEIGRPQEALVSFSRAKATGALNGSHMAHATSGRVLALLELGRAREASSHEPTLSPLNSKDRLGHNPALIALAKSRLALLRGDSNEAVHILKKFADATAGWMVPAHLSLRVHQFRLMRRYGMTPSPADVERSLALAERLQLRTRVLQLRRFQN